MTQSRIIQLSTQVANQIAAGEVVERPASVVKELLENCIDAQATKIEIDVEGGGLHLIRVRDNGAGIVKDDLALAFCAHATSKIRTQADLEAIHTMGFRGEALASIASVSHCSLASKPLHQTSAWQLQFTNQMLPSISPVAHPDGTTVTVANLFHNTPVRRKFLRSEKTEFQAIEEIVKRVALAFSEITISLRHQQKVIRHYPSISGANVSLRLANICGNQFVDNAAYFSMQAGNMALGGWLGFPSLAKRQADCQYFFVNQRMIKDRLLNHVIKTLYSEHPDMIIGTYPSYVLYLTVDPSDVDVNVHPTKQEVRFSSARMVHDFLSKCIRDTLGKMNDEPSHKPVLASASCRNTNNSKTATTRPTFKQSAYGSGALDALVEATHTVSPQEKSVKVSDRYAFVEENDGVVIIDIMSSKQSLVAFYFEKFYQQIPTKPLLFPLRITLKRTVPSPEKVITVLQPFGFHLQIDNNEATLLQQPTLLKEPLTPQALLVLIEASQQNTLLAIIGQQVWIDFMSLETSFLLEWVNSQTSASGWTRLSYQELNERIMSSKETAI